MTPAAASQTAPAPPSVQQAVNFKAFDNMPGVPRAWFMPGIVGLVLLGLGVVLAFISTATTQYQGEGNAAGTAAVAAIISGVALGITGLILYMWKNSKIQAAAYDQFLADNAFVPEPGDGLDMVATSLLGIGDDKRVTKSFTGQYRGRKLHAIAYQYTTGSGKSQQTHFFANLYIELNQAFPLIVLDRRNAGLMGLLELLPERIPNGRQLQLEGNFNDSYKVTVLPGTEQEVLQFLTPDFMSELLQSPKQTDVEIEGNKLFVITNLSGAFTGDFDGPTLQLLFAGADIVLKHLGEVAFSWQASSSPDTVATMAATALAPRSQMLLHKHHIGVGGALAILTWAGFNVLPGLHSARLMFAYFATLAVAAVVYLYWQLRH